MKDGINGDNRNNNGNNYSIAWEKKEKMNYLSIMKNKPKVHICFGFKNGPWGGGNQFLKNLRNYLKENKLYTNSYKKADVILFNSHHRLIKILMLKLLYPKKTFVHRLDGPIYYIRNKDKYKDKYIHFINRIIADVSIFQSRFSYMKNVKLGYKPRIKDAIIYNVTDKKIFNTKGKESSGKKIRLVASSWSNNMNKGFDVYDYLDKNLDFSKYDMTFIGNSPIKFKNIKMIGPLNSEDLAKELKEYDIYVTASKKDPCSNSLIEAIQCGLIPIALHDGGHPELLRYRNTFKNKEEFIEVLENIIEELQTNGWRKVWGFFKFGYTNSEKCIIGSKMYRLRYPISTNEQYYRVMRRIHVNNKFKRQI